MIRVMGTRREPVTYTRDLERVCRRLRVILDARQRRHVADLRFYQLLTENDREQASRKNSGPRR